MARVTRSHIVNLFTIFCNTGGFKISKGRGDPGLGLDYYSYGGGYQVVEVKEGSGGEHQPFGSRRYSPKEFAAVLKFAIDVLSADKYGYLPHTDPGRHPYPNANPARASFRPPFARRSRRR